MEEGPQTPSAGKSWSWAGYMLQNS